MLSNEQIKDGMKVTWTRRNGEVANGLVRGAIVMKTKGPFVTVENVDEKGKPNGKTNALRPSQLSKR